MRQRRLGTNGPITWWNQRPGQIAVATTAIILSLALLSAVGFGIWSLYWYIAGESTTNRYDVNTHSQQYQASLISQERDRVTGYDVAVVPAQKAQIASTFCAIYPSLDPPTVDLQLAHDRIC